MFSAKQVKEHGLWCQVILEDNMGMGDNIGDWYYPRSNGNTPDTSPDNEILSDDDSTNF